MPEAYSREEVEQELNDEEIKKNLRYIGLLPGGKQLLERLGV